MIRKKRHKRVPFKATVMYGPHKPPKHISCMTNLSDSGAFLCTIDIFDPGTKLHLIIRDEKVYHEVDAIVIRANSLQTHDDCHRPEHGMGVRFTEVNINLQKSYKEKLLNKLPASS